MITFDQASALIAGVAKPLGRERVTLGDAHGRVLAAPVIARLDSPERDCSAMDGYAVRESDVAVLPARLRLAGSASPGREYSGALDPGDAVRVFTGAFVPPGTERVIVQELASPDGDHVVFDAPHGASRHIRRQASDFRRGDRLLVAGALLGPRALVAAAAADIAEVEAWRRPIVAIASTGDELVDPGQALDRCGAIPESISLGVTALARDWQARIGVRCRLADDLDAMQAAALELVEGSDLVVVTGGASVGERDHAKAMFDPFGLELIFSTVAIKPGKPAWLGRVRGTLVLGLPGNPTSAMVVARLFLAPLLAGLGGREPDCALAWRSGTLAAPLSACGDRETFVRAVFRHGEVLSLENQESSAQKSLAEAELLVRRHAGAPGAAAGDEVEIIDF